jgi:hypothetical protein
MQATVNAKALQNALDSVSKVVFSGSSVLNDQLILSTEDAKLNITYAAFDAAMFITLEATNTAVGEVSCSFEKFSSIASAMPSGGTISLNASTQILIESGKHKVKLPLSQLVKGAFAKSSSASMYAVDDLLDRISRAATFARDSVTISDNAIIGTDGLVFASYAFQNATPLKGGISEAICKKLKRLGAKITSVSPDTATYAFRMGDTDQLIARKVAEDVRLAPILDKMKDMAQPIAPVVIEKEKIAELLSIGSKLSEAATITINKTSVALSTEGDAYSGSFDIAGPDQDIKFKCNLKDFTNMIDDIQQKTFELRTTSEDTIPIILNSALDMYVTTKIV